MKREELLLLWFDYNEVSFAKAEQFLACFDNFDMIFDKNLLKNAVFKDRSLELIRDKILLEDFEKFEQRVLQELSKFDITFLTYLSSGYPEKLKTISDPPLVLYLRGDVSLLSKKSISVVGSRKPSDYGKIVAEKFVKELSSAGLVTVSGLAYGIDTIVATSTLEAGGKTIAVLAGGLDSIYPAQNKMLSKKIEQNGLLISEKRPTIKPLQFSFINRNRIISALSLGTLIVEAGKNSGTMSTAKFAIEQARELFVVPGNIYSLQSEGTNNLIDEMPDTFTISPDRILYKLKIKKKQTKAQSETNSSQIDFVQKQILDVLSKGECTFDKLCELTGINPGEMSANLIKMELFGLVKKGDSNTYFKL